MEKPQKGTATLPQPITTGAPLTDYKVRDGVTQVIAYWKLKTPMLHSTGAKCMKIWPDLELKDRQWLETEFAEALSSPETGAETKYQFCTRCVVTTKAPTSATAAEPAAVVEAAAGEPAPKATARKTTARKPRTARTPATQK